MERRGKLALALVAGTLALVVGTSPAHAVINHTKFVCQAAIAKESAKYVNGLLKLYQKCRNKELKETGTCANPTPESVQKLKDKLRSGLAKKCTFIVDGLGDVTVDNLKRLGFPGPCVDANSLNGFTLTDLQDCIETSHLRRVTGVCGGGSNLNEACTVVGDCPDSGPGTSCTSFLTYEYDPTVPGPHTGTRLKCQTEIAKNSGKFLAAYLKAVQKCRNDLLDCDVAFGGAITCKLSGIQAENCATDVGPDLDDDPMATKFANQKTIDSIAKARSKAEAAIIAKCSDPADVAALKICEPDQGTAAAGAACETNTHQLLADNPDPTALDDLLDFEYATRGTCGDNRKNQGTEECDGPDDDACPGLCGAASGFFGCLCQNEPRQRVIEHSNSDLDNGWSGQSHDSGIVEGGGYVSDLWDCDGPLISDDHLCTVGPSCNNPPHQICNPAPGATGTAANANSLCTGGGNFCRKTPAASNGPHCDIEFNKRCQTDAQCTGDGDRCIKTFHGSPLPLSSGGVSVCIINVFSEDVVGTTDLLDGSGSVRLRQDSTTNLGPNIQQPCPVCGGFCSGPGSQSGPGVRNLCTSDLDCSGGATCVTDLICSYGPNVDGKCRPNPPFGGDTEFFGNPSTDCPPAQAPLGTLDILFNPATTGSTTATATFDCGTTGYNHRVCIGGSNDKRTCTVASECPGGLCNEQCYCGGGAQKPNACFTACFGGGNDAQPCGADTDCPGGGFCRVADCRANPGDTDSTGEGICSLGPTDGTCSTHTFKTCSVNSDCADPVCTFCDPGETCVFNVRQCFTNGQYTRAGAVGTPDRISAATFCIAPTSSPSVNSVAGLPGPGAITQPASTQEVGF